MPTQNETRAQQGGAQGAAAPTNASAGDKPAEKPAPDPRDARIAALERQLAEATAAKAKAEQDHEQTLEEVERERQARERYLADGVAELRGAQGAPGVVRLSGRSGPVRRFVAKSTLVLALDGDRTKVGEGEEFEATDDELAGLTAGVHFERL